MPAISPAINEPFTTLTCLDYLADGLALPILDAIGQKTRSTEAPRALHYARLIQAEGRAGTSIDPDQQRIRLHGEMLKLKRKTKGI